MHAIDAGADERLVFLRRTVGGRTLRKLRVRVVDSGGGEWLAGWRGRVSNYLMSANYIFD